MVLTTQGWEQWIKKFDARLVKEVTIYFINFFIDQSECPGHFGNIELAKPVYHAGLLDFLRKVLKTVCFNCSKIMGFREEKERKDILIIKKANSRFNKVFK